MPPYSMEKGFTIFILNYAQATAVFYPAQYFLLNLVEYYLIIGF